MNKFDQENVACAFVNIREREVHVVFTLLGRAT